MKGLVCLSESGFIHFNSFTRDTINFKYLQSLIHDKRISRQEIQNMYMVLEGGEDISPSLYGENVRFAMAPSAPSKRDILNYEMLQFAQRYRIPVIGICRGHQIINVYCGGALYQDIYYDLNILHIDHNHIVYLCVDNDIYKKTVNSIHHQAVKVVPNGSKITAVTEDGIIEGIYYPSSKFGTAMYGVQWHPEIAHDSELIKIILNVLYRDLRGYTPFDVTPLRMEKIFSVLKNTSWTTELVKRKLVPGIKEDKNGGRKFKN